MSTRLGIHVLPIAFDMEIGPLFGGNRRTCMILEFHSDVDPKVSPLVRPWFVGESLLLPSVVRFPFLCGGVFC